MWLNVCCLLVFVVYWWVLCCFTIGWSYSTTTICYQQRNWMAGSWGVAEWFLWYFYWCNCCPVSNWTYKPCLRKLILFPALLGQTKLYSCSCYLMAVKMLDSLDSHELEAEGWSKLLLFSCSFSLLLVSALLQGVVLTEVHAIVQWIGKYFRACNIWGKNYWFLYFQHACCSTQMICGLLQGNLGEFLQLFLNP